MPRISEITDDQASAKVRELFDAAHTQLGMVPNVYRAMAHSPAVLSTFMHMQQSLQGGALDRQFQQQIAVLVAQFDCSSYCLAVNTAIGLHVGLSEEELRQARRMLASDHKRQAGLEFVLELLQHRGMVSEEMFNSLVSNGYTSEEIAEILAHVGFNLFANYFNLAAQTTPDFPAVSLDLLETHELGI